MNSLVVITLDGTRIVYECHSHSQALAILAGQYVITPQIESFKLV